MANPPVSQRVANAVRQLHWKRGLRAGLAVAAAMVVCHLLSGQIGWAAGWAALGGFEAILVDNGGPYRTRFITIATLLAGGSLGCIAAAFAHGEGPVAAILLPVLVTAGFCFLVTFGRVVAQPVASTSVIILVIYFAAWGSGTHSLRQALWNALAFVLGGAWAAVLSLVLWPVDPFRPARHAVSLCYESLAEFTAGLEPTERGSPQREQARTRAFELQRRLRSQIESARTALAMTAARAPSRTVRARNLTVLLETVDMLFAVTMRATELALGIEASDARPIAAVEEVSLRQFTGWLSDAERSIAVGLQSRPSDDFVLCLPEGAAAARNLSRRASSSSSLGSEARSLLAHLAAAELDAWQNIEIACEAAKAVWSGVEVRAGSAREGQANPAAPDKGESAADRPAFEIWAEAVLANWTLDSVMMRHALRTMLVGAVDVLLLRVLHLRNGYWLAMTSIIVLQPYPSHTLKRSAERVGGTIAGGILAAMLAAAIPNQWGIIAVVSVTATLTLATYAVDYAWYCFFLTPTFVLLSLPHLRDWEFSGVRMLTTLLGALVSVAAMRLLWPEREHLALGKLLARAAGADAAYIRATLRYWEALRANAAIPGGEIAEERRLPQRQIIDRQAIERQILAPARRAGGLASNDAEESLDRLMQESGFGNLAGPKRGRDTSAQIKDHALTFVTYLRRLRQSTTTLAVLAKASLETVARLEGFAARLDAMSAALRNGGGPPAPRSSAEPKGRAEQQILLVEDTDIGSHQLQRMQRQIAVLERAAAGLGNTDSAA
jgi:uncharacterized membrane protein YccC